MELRINGAPLGDELGRSYVKGNINARGSVMVVIATDACIESRNLRRLAARSQLGLARTGYVSENGSGDYYIAFSTSETHRPNSEQSPVNYLKNERHDSNLPSSNRNNRRRSL